MLNKKQAETILLLLQRSQVTLFRPSGNKMASFPFPPELVADLEVKEEAKLVKAFEAFLNEQKLSPCNVVFLLDSSVYFTQKIEVAATQKIADKEAKEEESSTEAEKEPETKEITHRQEEIEEQQRKFVQSIPFANVYSGVLTFGKEKIIVAMNREFYEPLMKALTNKKHEVSTILPIMVATDIFSSGFKVETATVFLHSLDKFKAHNLIQISSKKEEVSSVTALPKDESGKKRLLLFSGVFIVLIGILGAVLMMTQSQEQTKKAGPAMPAQPGQVATPTPEPSPSPSPQVVVSSAVELRELLAATESAELAQLSVTVIDAGSDGAGTQALVSQLEEVGFEQVTTGTAQSLTAGNMVVTASESVPLTLLEALERQLQVWGYTPSFEVSDDQSPAISILRTSQ